MTQVVSNWVPATHLGDRNGVPGFSGFSLAQPWLLAGILGSGNGRYLFHCVCLSNKKIPILFKKKKKRDYFPKAVQQITTHGIPSNKSFIIS